MPKTYYSAKQLEERFNRTNITLGRWVADEKLGFPKPIYIRGRRFWPVEAIEQWEKSRLVMEA